MTQRSKVFDLPPEIRSELETRLISGGFAGYADLETWLRAQGYEISKSSIHRHGKNLEQRVDKIRVAREQARAIAEACPDEEGQLLEAASALAQQQIFELLLNIDIDPNEVKMSDLNRAVRGLADLGRSTISLKKHQAEVREKLRAASAEIRKTGGISDETLAKIDTLLLGIVP